MGGMGGTGEGHPIRFGDSRVAGLNLLAVCGTASPGATEDLCPFSQDVSPRTTWTHRVMAVAWPVAAALHPSCLLLSALGFCSHSGWPKCPPDSTQPWVQTPAHLPRPWHSEGGREGKGLSFGVRHIWIERVVWTLVATGKGRGRALSFLSCPAEANKHIWIWSVREQRDGCLTREEVLLSLLSCPFPTPTPLLPPGLSAGPYFWAPV